MRSTYLRNKELDTLDNVSFAVPTAYVSLHAGNPGITGSNEVAGGSYARQPVSLAAAAAAASSNDTAVNFTGMPAVVSPGLTHTGMWDAVTAGNFLWAGPVGVALAVPFTAANTGDLFTAPAHGLVNGDMLDLVDVFNGVIPTGVTEFTNYFVVGAATNTFQVAATSGGAAIVLTTDGSGLVRRIQPKVVNSGETVNIAIAALTLAHK